MGFLYTFEERVVIGILVDAREVEVVDGRCVSGLFVGMMLENLFTI